MKEHEAMILEEYVPQYHVTVDEYAPFIGRDGVENVKRIASEIEGKSWTNVNSTMMGGGVAEILRSAIPLARALGLDAKWYVIQGNDDFFRVTKKFHNMLQGKDTDISLEEIFYAYLNTIDENTRNVFIASDLVVIHDPQPAAMVMNEAIWGNVLWRCHIDTANPNEIIWRFLLPYINQCSGAIFTLPEFIGPGVRIPIYQILPCIDPLSEKNRQYTPREAIDVLEPMFNAHGIDPDRPVFAAVSRYDSHKNQAAIVKAFKLLREKKAFNPPPYLIFLGNSAKDDPEGMTVLQELQELAGDDKDIFFWLNVENNDKIVGALMNVAKAFIHVSTKEGFGLVVTEALWQSTPVIGSSAGGIKKQVIDGETGYVVKPADENEIAHAMERILENAEEASALGAHGREHVKNNFLLPELVGRYMKLLRYYINIDNAAPDFRLNDITYSEMLHVIRRRTSLT